MSVLPAQGDVAIAIPARDEEKTIVALLEALLAQSHPPQEIIVADGGSTDRTLEIVSGYRARGVVALDLGPALPGRGRNAAIGSTHQPWVALIDAGCRPQPSWLEELLAPIRRDGELDVVFGDHVPRLNGEWDRIQALTIMSPRDPRSGLHGPSVASMLLRRSIWERVGGFREDLRAAEDHLFFAALAMTGARTAWAPRAVVEWQLSPDLAAAWRRLVSYSEHHLRAGLFATWHFRVMSMDIAALAVLLLLPMSIAASIVLLAIAARTVYTAWRRRDNVPDQRPLTLTRVAGAAILLALADAAVWVGAARVLLLRGSTRP